MGSPCIGFQGPLYWTSKQTLFLSSGKFPCIACLFLDFFLIPTTAHGGFLKKVFVLLIFSNEYYNT